MFRPDTVEMAISWYKLKGERESMEALERTGMASGRTVNAKAGVAGTYHSGLSV